MIDRDGTLIEERNYLSSPSQLVLIERSADAIRMLRASGLRAVIVTNQSGIGRGYFSADDVAAVHDRLSELLAESNAAVDGIYVCPHTPDEGCSCRKPAPALAERAAADFGAELAKAFVVGDKECDLELGRAVGATTILVRTGYGAAVAGRAPAAADYVVDDLYAAANVICDLVSMEKSI